MLINDLEKGAFGQSTVTFLYLPRQVAVKCS